MSFNAPKGRGTSKRFSILFLIVSLAIWLFKTYQDKKSSHQQPSRKPSTFNGHASSPSKPQGGNANASRQGEYEVYHGCVLADDHNNDGDSFRVQLPDGKNEIFRLYYVDTPESKFKRYKGGESNFQRISQQAAEMGGVTPEQVVKIGETAKKMTFALLRKPFTLYTVWDSPFNDQRYHAFIEIEDQGKKIWLHRHLIEQGVARIKTKPATMPDGTAVEAEKNQLRQLESTAKKENRGVWSL